jgi:hypothetical protein
MRFRRLRIAWSVGCGIACSLLIVLWVRSYWRQDSFSYRASTFDLTIAARQGETGFMWTKTDFPIPSALLGISARSKPIDGLINHRRFIWQKNSGLIWAPIWALALFVGLLSAAPWIRQRFTLRTLLVATALIAVVLGLIVWLNHH